ncbi:hypothetical protein [Salisediminibacterium selenitireducens]|uniref:Uncharacterized protein n=1 Tax=Bacillus selenitireducens (strain ATCC 700615 / DSM 15326 / MLS10) TaxID=439292 RepID=D6Y0G5_BACIE|nr:hypothetical protein [Salisediminibacterium selenitireducens]ADH98556.1 hypothetical protein Bsel_1037 [[Bacillus] selenitireducens MLS10]
MTHEYDGTRQFYLDQLAWLQEQQRIYEEIEGLLREMRDVAVTESDETLSDYERQLLQEEIHELNDRVDALYREFDPVH